MVLSSKIYLDYAATTPVDPVVVRAMRPYFSEKFGNAGSLHSFGQDAIAALDASRETVAVATHADFREIIFTGSATEANNLALRGTRSGPLIAHRKSLKPRIIVSAIEHESVLETARDMEKNGTEVVYLPVNKVGVVDLKKLETSLNENTVLVSIMYANNEIGTIQPIASAAKIINDFKNNQQPVSINQHPLFHTDAAQALQFLDCDARALGVDLMTLSSHKIYGPKGAGALYVKEHTRRLAPSAVPLIPHITGGGQEFGLRAGTENIPAIAGFAKAIELAGDVREKEAKRTAALRAGLWCGIRKIYSKARTNGVLSPWASGGKRWACLPNILNVYFPGRDAQDLLAKFYLAGLAVSSGSACRARVSTSSRVLEAIGCSKEQARSSVRFSLGRPTTKEEIARAIGIVKNALR